MKCVMYHYVRPAPAGLDFFRYLHVEDFRRQLDWFAQSMRLVSRAEFLEETARARAPDGVVLTFDDGFADHYTWVLPELERRGLWGIFFVPTAMYRTGKLLDVHRIHALLGRCGGAEAMRRLDGVLRDDMISHGHIAEFRRQTYRSQDNDQATTAFKRVLNYLISYEWRERVLDGLMAEAFGPEEELAKNFYLTPEQIREMHRAGMMIGSHGAHHLLFRKLEVAEQEREIRDSFAYLAEVTGQPVELFCYPYGGFHSFTAETERLLAEYGSRMSFNVEPRDVTAEDLRNRPQALPRYDCNLFPYGQASFGARLAG